MTWHLTVYSGDAPNGASLGTVDEFTELTYRHAVRGEGKGTVKINRYHPQAALLQQGRYCRVHTNAGVVGAFWLLEGPVGLSSEDEEGGENIEWSGSGALHYLDRAKMTATSRITGGHDPIEGRWALHDQGPGAGPKSAHPIPGLRRVIAEALLLPGNPLSDLTFDFTYTHDSDNQPAPVVDGEFYANVGESVRDLALRFTELGLYVQMTADLELRAFMEFGEDRTGAFGPSTARFEKGVNIAAPIERRFDEDVQKTHLMVGGMDQTYVEVVNPDYTGGVARWGWMSMPETADESALIAAAHENFKARKRASDVFSFPLPDHGDDPSNGIYEPGLSGHFWVGDLVSMHTGNATYDVDEHAVEVAAITWTTRDGDDYDVIVELGHTFFWSERPEWRDPFIGGVPGSQSPLELCRPGVIIEAGAASCALTADQMTAIHDANGGFETGGTTNWSFSHISGQVEGPTADAGEGDFYYRLGGAGWALYHPFSGRTFFAGTTYVARALAKNKSNGFLRLGYLAGDPESPDVAEVSAVNSSGGVWEEFCVEWTPNADRDGADVRVQLVAVGQLDNFDVDDVRVYEGGDEDLLVGGDGHPDLIGTSPRAARCDHRHDVHRDRAPTVDDDESVGYMLGTIWAQLDDLETPTEIVGVWMLVDESEDLAIWLSLGTGDGGGGDMDNPMTTAGDIITGGASGDPERLAIGSNDQVLKVVSGAPAWAAESGDGSTPDWFIDANAAPYNAVPDNSTDATTAITDAIADAVAAAVSAASGVAIVELDEGTYLIGGALNTSQTGNAQIPIPNLQSVSQVYQLIIRAKRRSSPILNLGPGGGAILRSTLTGQSYSGTHGLPSIIGGPTYEKTSAFTLLRVQLEGIGIRAPDNPSLCGADFSQMHQAVLDDCRFDVNVASSFDSAEPTNPTGLAILMPRVNNNSAADYRGFCYFQGWYAGPGISEHTQADKIGVFACKVGINIQGNYYHGAQINHAAVEFSPHVIASVNPESGLVDPSGASGFSIFNIDFLDIEDAQAGWHAPTNHINDPGDKYHGVIRYVRVTANVGTQTGALTLNGGANLLLIDLTTIDYGVGGHDHDAEYEPLGAVATHNADPAAHAGLSAATHRLVILHDFGSGLVPIPDDTGHWLYGAFPGPQF